MDAARFASAGGEVAQKLVSIQPALALLYGAELSKTPKSSSPGKSKGILASSAGLKTVSKLAKLPDQSQVWSAVSEPSRAFFQLHWHELVGASFSLITIAGKPAIQGMCLAAGLVHIR